MLGIGLIGSGAMARTHAERIAEMEDAEVVAVASPNTADEFVAERVPDASAYADAEALCDDPGVDAVDVCSPTHLHPEQVELAADRGLDVLVEKPLARTMEGANAVRDAVADAGITCMVGHVVRFFPEYATAKERLDAGDVGDVGVARARRAVGFAGPRGWFGDEEKSGGVLLDLAIHDFDFLRWAVGDVDRVFSRLRRWGDDDESQSSLTLVRFENGAVGHVDASWMRLGGLPFTQSFEFAGDDGLVEYDNDDVRPIEHVDDEGVHVPRDPVGDELPLAEDGYRRELEAFVDCVRNGGEPPVTVEEGRRSLAVALAAIESAERGEPVPVEDLLE